MFNLFKPKVAATKVVESNPAKDGYPQIVHEIHNEFLTASDKGLQEANEILKNAGQKAIEKGSRLSALGFKNCPEVASSTALVQTEQVAKLIEQYRVYYPNNKFILESQVKQICEKYGLIFGDISMYKGFVPELKLAQIEKFKIRQSDIVVALLTDGRGNILKQLGVDAFDKNKIGDWSFRRMMNKNDFYYDSDKAFQSHNILFNLPQFSKIQFSEIGLRICAPLKDMEIPSGMEVKGYKVQNIPDPVVLHPIVGGYLILAAWGDEASDELVINQTQN